MFMSMLFLSLWPSQKEPVLAASNWKPPTSSFASPDAAELARLRGEKANLEGQVQQLQISLNGKDQERLKLTTRIEASAVEKATFEEQVRQLRVKLEAFTAEKVTLEEQARRLRAELEVSQSAARSSMRRTSSSSTASPPSSPMQDMVPKEQLDAAQALAQRMEKVAGSFEKERNQFEDEARALRAQLALPSVEEQKKEWQEKIGDLRRLMLALEKVKPPPVPELDLSGVSRRGSAVDPLNASFKGNGSFSRARRESMVRRGSPPRLRRESIAANRVAGTSPLQEPFVLSGHGSPQEQSLTSFPLFQALEGEVDRLPQWVELEQWRKAYGELKRYLEKIKAPESSDDDFFSASAASTSAVISAQSETELVSQLRKEMRELSTEKSQFEVTLDAQQKEILRLTAERNALLKATGLSGNDLTHAASGEVTIGKRLPLAVALDNLCALLKRDHKRVVKRLVEGGWQVEKVPSGWCC